MGKYDKYLTGLSSAAPTGVAGQPIASTKKSNKYDKYLTGLPEDGPPPGFHDESEIRQDYPMRRKISRYLVRPAIEGGAMTLGGAAGAIAGAPAGPIASGLGAAAMGAAMYPPAHQAANVVDEMLGLGGWKRPVGGIPEQLAKTAQDFSTGLEMEAGGKVLRGASEAIGPVLKGAIPTFLGPSKEAVAARMTNNEVIRNAPSYLQQAERLPVVLKNMGKVIDKLYEKASGTLRNSAEVSQGAVPLSYVNKMIGGLQEKLKVGQATVGSADQAASGKLGALISDMNDIVKQPKMPEIVGPTGQVINLRPKEVYLPETTVHKLIQRVRKNIDFSDKSASSTNSVLTDVSGQLDAGLKTGNKGYAAAMKPVSTLMRLSTDAADKFSLTKRTGEGFAPTDATIASMKSLPTERRGVSQGIAKRLKVATGEDLVGTSKNRQLAEQFVGENTQGSRRTLGGATIGTAIGAGLGHLVGSPGVGASIGSTVGGIAGMATDKSGRQLAGNIIDSYVRAKPFLAKLPYEVVVRLVTSGVLGDPDSRQSP